MTPKRIIFSVCFQAGALALLLAVGCSHRRGLVPDTTLSSLPPGTLSRATLKLAEAAVSPGGELRGDITIQLAPGYHTYADPPGDSGMPPMISFSLPEGWSGECLPLPPAQTFTDAAGTTFGYENKLSISCRIRAPKTAQLGSSVDISIDIQWLICNEQCLPQTANLSAVLKVID